jgi:hypothetical protein
MPVDRAVFLVSDSGRIKETSTSVPPQRAHEEFSPNNALMRVWPTARWRRCD